MQATLVRYRVKPEHAERNRELIQDIYAELSAAHYGDFRYAAFALEDGVTFIHLYVGDSERNGLADVPAFRRFRETFSERCDESPTVERLEQIGSHAWFEDVVRHWAQGA